MYIFLFLYAIQPLLFMQLIVVVGSDTFVITEAVSDAYGKSLIVPFSATHMNTAFNGAVRIIVDLDGLLLTCARGFSLSVRDRVDGRNSAWLCSLTNKHDCFHRIGHVIVEVVHGAVHVRSTQQKREASFVSCILI